MAITMKGIRLGQFGLDLELLLFPHPKYILHTHQHEAHHHWYQCPVLSYIIETPEGRILFETGVSAHPQEEWAPEWQFLVDLSEMGPETSIENRLKELKLGPDDFRWVVQGHLHTDHAGGLRTFEQAGADIIVHEDEYRWAESVTEPEHFFNPVDYEVLKTKKPVLVSGETELTRGVKLVELPGHTPGNMGMLIELDHTGLVLLTSDALYHHESYGPPGTGSPIVWDAGAWAQSVEKIRQLALEREALIFPGHDDTAIKQFKDRTEFRSIEFSPNYEYA